jgi:protein-tyrosine phosphatase
MFDIHYHMLFNLDDGPKTIEDSLALAQASIGEGVTHVVCTPHANDSYTYNSELCREEIATLNEHLRGELTLGLGCDFHLSYENIQDLNRDRTKYTINGNQFLLVEFPDYGIPVAISEVFYRMIASGIVPVLTHPERNQTLVTNPNRMIDWLRSGCLVQITAASLSGHFGKKAESFSHRLLAQNWVHFIASDAHSIERRPPSMAPAYNIVKAQYGQETADRLCLHNPRAAFFGEDLPQQPDPMEVWDELKSPKRRFFGLFGGR